MPTELTPEERGCECSNCENGNAPPEIVYLQWHSDWRDHWDGDVTWCVDRINDSDIEYVPRAAAEAERQCECGAAYAHASWMSYCPECGGSLPAIREGSDE